jgi:thymidylate synthase (FAD)
MTDRLFRVDLIAATPNPQQCVYAGMHQDYSEGFVAADRANWPDETRAGEICVKRLLAGNRGHYGCYSEDTEVLTDQGWKLWPSVSSSDKLAAVNITDNSIKFEYPSALQEYQIEPGDKLYMAKSQKISLAVTLDHRMVYSTRTDSTWRFGTAASLAGKPVIYKLSGKLSESQREIPQNCPENCDLSSLFKLAGFFYGDGLRTKNKNPGCIRFRLRLARKINYLKSLGFAVRDCKGDRFTVDLGSTAKWIIENFSDSSGKVCPEFILKLPSALFISFMDGLKNSDGTIKNSSWSFDSTNLSALELIQAACHLNDMSASLSLNNPNNGPGHENHSPCWRIHISSIEPKARFEVCQKGRTRGEEKLIPYSGKVYCATVSTGALLVRKDKKPVVCGNCLEHPAITLNCGWFPHSVMQQARTHRVGVSFDVQSGRYTSKRFVDCAEGKRDVEEVFYLRPVGRYNDRQGKKYEYTAEQRLADLDRCLDAAKHYALRLSEGMAEEQARGLIPFDFRQHFVVSYNLRSVLHFMDLRSKLDAQEEIRDLCDLMWPHVQTWAPEIASWYALNRMGRARLAP